MSSSVYLIFGEDEYLVSARAKKTIDGLVAPENRLLSLEIIDGRTDTVETAVGALRQCIEALRTMGLGGSQKVVWLRDAAFLADNVTARSDLVKERVNTLASMITAGLSPGQILVVTSPKVDKRFAFYKACKRMGEIDEFAVPEKGYLIERQAEERLDEALSQAGLSMASDVRIVFLEKVGTDTRRIVNEIEKLAVYLGKGNPVHIHDIEAVTSVSRGVLAWDLADAVGKRDLGRAQQVFRRLIFQKESPIGLMIVLENRIRELTIYREALDKGWLTKKKSYGGNRYGWADVPPDVDTIFSEEFTKDPRATHAYRVGLLVEQAKLFSRQDLRTCWEALLDAHVKLISSAVPKPMTLELLLIRMLS